MTTQALLVELQVEELPPRALKGLGADFARLIVASLQASALVAAQAEFSAFATPRRLAVRVQGVLAHAPSRAQQTKLMPVAVGLDAQGAATPALKKKLAALGQGEAVLPQLKRQGEGKNEVLVLDSMLPGATLAEGLNKALAEMLAKLPIAKVMQYQLADGWSSVHFVRPAHGLVALHGAQVVAVQALGLDAGRSTQGHRFEAATPTIEISHADDYERILATQGAVIASFALRRAEVQRQLHAAALSQGLTPIQDEALLDEVTALVERPNTLVCRFEQEYLAVPQECLILTMKANQKYFPLLDAQGRLTNRFLVVSNIAPTDASRVIEGNERVVRPRLADAKFFFDQDRKKSLAARVPDLARVVYHQKLGTQGERALRVQALAQVIAQQIGGAALAAAAGRAAQLAKADLLTDMVGEFPELQGVMGGYYARHDGESEEVAFAIEDHYKPRFAGDALPRGAAGLAVALADKLETLAGLFGIGQLPSGDKDPFALRRHALGVARMLVEAELPLAVPALVDAAFRAFPAGHGQAQAELVQFMLERLLGYLRELGYSAHEVDAVTALRPDTWASLPQRLAAVRAFAALPEAAALAAANKRVGNILKKSDGAVPAAVNEQAFTEDAERALNAALMQAGGRADSAFASGDFTASLRELAALRAPVDAFFDGVMVNAEDPAVRANRLALLAQLHGAMNRVADLSRLAA